MSNIWQAHSARLIPGDTILIDNFDGTTAPLPSLPLSLCSHARELFRRCYERHGRCVAAILLYDMRDHRWMPPRIPDNSAASGTPRRSTQTFLMTFRHTYVS